MGRKRTKRLLKKRVAAVLIVLVIAACALFAQKMDSWLFAPVENAGQQLTVYSNQADGAHVFMNGVWHTPRNVQTMLLIGIDKFSGTQTTNSYNNSSQADFLALFVHDTDTGENAVIHLNRDTMTRITVLGVTGDAAGTRTAQLALAYNYGSGAADSCQNTVEAVSHLLYSVEIDHYLAVTMDSVPLINDWAGGVKVTVADDFSGVDEALTPGSEVVLRGEQALTYVRTRMGLDDSTNLQRMKRQRQYASAWVDAARPKLSDESAVMQLVMDMSDYHYSDCTAEQLAQFADMLSGDGEVVIHELSGQAVQGDQFMEFYASDEQVQQLVLNLFYKPL